MNRRDAVIALLALGASPLTFAQQPAKVWRVGFLVQRSRPASLDADTLGEFPQAMRELGYVEGGNLVIEWRFADNRADRLPGLAAELVVLKADVIVSQTTATTRAMQKATATIPIVMASVADPVASGFVKSLARPEANITGLANQASDLGPKQLEFLLGMIPKLSHVAMLVNRDSPITAVLLRTVQDAAQKAGIEVVPFDASNAKEIVAGFSGMTKVRAGALIVAADALYVEQRQQIADLALKHRLPCVSPYKELTEAGGLASYGTSRAASYRRIASFVDRILKGAKPGDLPVEQPTTFELVINRKTATALGLTIPQSVLLRADRVIE